MSSRIYFKDANSKSMQWWVTRMVTRSIAMLPSDLRLKISRKLLLKPQRIALPALPPKMHAEKMKSPYGELQMYTTGVGPTVLFIHGWSGAASQFFPLMTQIAEQGYQCVAYDQIAHGESSGTEANLPLFIKTKEWLCQQLQKKERLEAIVSHSMGSVAAVNSLKEPIPMLLIAPVFDFVTSFKLRVQQSGVLMDLLELVLTHVEGEYGLKFSELDPRKKLLKLNSNIHIVHDRNDRFANFRASCEVAEKHGNIELTLTEDLGHGRIINSVQTLEAFCKLVG